MGTVVIFNRHVFRHLSHPRRLTDNERAIAAHMIEYFSRADQRGDLCDQLDELVVSDECITCPTIVFNGLSPNFRTSAAHVRQRPLEACDAAGAESKPQGIHLLLHIVDGKLGELELYRNNGEPIETLPPIETLVVPSG